MFRKLIIYKSRLIPSFRFKSSGRKNKDFLTLNQRETKKLLKDSVTPDTRVFSLTQSQFASRIYPESYDKMVSPEDEGYTRNIDYSGYSSILFSGQGSQFVGMGQKLLERKDPVIDSLYEKASEILGYDLKEICFQGPALELDRTLYSQPAIFVCSLASIEALYADSPEAITQCISTAGFSVGELAALVFSGALKYEDGLKLVKVRAEEMEKCCQKTPSGMMTIFYGTSLKLESCFQAAKKWCKEEKGIRNPVISVSNHLYSEAKVIAGHIEALEYISDNKSQFEIRKTKMIPVSGAFHTSLMSQAVKPFAEVLENTRIFEPKIPVYSNVTHKIYRNPKDIRKILPSQIIKPVKWEQTMNEMFNYEDVSIAPNVYETGPGKALCGILRKINGKIGKKAKYGLT